ncbi:MAG TPA: CBS domain-containing protein [Steroidobacteraceae bacterium]|nr:CBS domain-containing protein [Steroidobacteraceae bacterium]
MKIGRLCNHDVVTVHAGEPLSTAAREMCDRHVGMVVVVSDRLEERIPVGIVTDRDIVRAQLRQASDLFCLSVAQVMSEPPLTLSENEAMTDAIERMRARGVRRAPVVDARGALTGVVSMDDLLGAISEQLAGLATLAASQRRSEAVRSVSAR